MYAIVKAGGTQIKVSPFDVVRVPKLAHGEGEEIKFGEVLLVRGQDNIVVGRPAVEGAEVSAKVLSHGRYRKVEGFKFKKRKKYRRTWGSREAYTELVITGITAPGFKPEVESQAQKPEKAKRAPARKPASSPGEAKAKKAGATKKRTDKSDAKKKTAEKPDDKKK